MNRVLDTFRNWTELTGSRAQRAGGGCDEAREVEKMTCKAKHHPEAFRSLFYEPHTATEVFSAGS